MIVSTSDYTVTQALNGLVTQLRAGVPLPKALGVCATGVRRWARPAFQRASKRALEGATFEELLTELAPVLTFAERASLATAWSGGRIDETMASIVARRQVALQMGRTIRARMVQPVLTLIVAAFIVPAIPFLRGRIDQTEFLIRGFTPLGIFFAAILFCSALYRWRMNALNSQSLTAPPVPEGTMDLVMMYTPLIWVVERQRNISEFCDLLAFMLLAGVRNDIALKQCARALPNGVYRMELERLANETRAGNPLDQTMPASHLWPPEFTAILHTAELSGSLEDALLAQSKYWRELYLESVKWWGTIVSRVLYIAVSIYVIYQFFYVGSHYLGTF